MANIRIRTVLLVEDDADVRLLMRLSLRPDPRLDITAHTETAEDALRLVGEHQPDLILLDHGLAGAINGLDAAPLLKRVAPWAKVVLLSALDLHRVAATAPGVDHFLRKDQMRGLLGVVQDVLGLEPPMECPGI